MNSRTFISINGLKLIIKNRKSAVVFELEESQANNEHRFSFQFTSEDFIELLEYIKTAANKSWLNLSPNEADSLSADYYEYYDKEFDNNGYLNIKDNCLFIERPSLESNKLYQFNKRKMESFVYDIKKLRTPVMS